MNRWPEPIQHLTRAEIMDAIKCDDWQASRLSMKGIPTRTKLDWCWSWLELGCDKCCNEARRKVQIDNYINALKRGGQLDVNGIVVR